MIRAAIRGLAPYASRVRRQIAAMLLIAVVGSAAEVTALLIAVRAALSLSSGSEIVVDLPLIGDGLDADLVLLLAAICGLAALLAHAALAFLTGRVISNVLADVRASVIDRYVEAGWPTQALQREGSLQETVTTLASRTAWLAHGLTSGGAQLISVLVFVVTAMFVSPLVTLFVVALGGLLVAALRPVSKATRRHARGFVTAESAYAQTVARLTSSMMEARVFGAQQAVRDELMQASNESRRKQLRSRFFTLFGSGLYKDLAVLTLVACVWVLSAINSNEMGDIGLVVALMLRSLSSAQAVNGAVQGLNENMPNLQAINARVADLAAGAAPIGTQPFEQIAPLEFRDVAYSYTDEQQTLSDISFTMQRGEAIGVVGPSGGGKSTLVQVLLRLRPPTSGAVLVDGRDYLTLDDAAWARSIAFVPQEPTLLTASVADNIRFYRDIPREEIEAAAREANVYDDIMRLPEGFDTRLGPRGSGLSGGQKQRVAIARALVGHPQLLVMDEPSSALDVRSEQLLQQSIDRIKGHATILIVAHRMTTVESCDRLIVLEHGRIAQIGTPAALLAQDGFYRSIQDGRLEI